jgi:hypothetical protein
MFLPNGAHAIENYTKVQFETEDKKKKSHAVRSQVNPYAEAIVSTSYMELTASYEIQRMDSMYPEMAWCQFKQSSFK